MKVTILREAGYDEALLGLSLSYNADIDRMPKRAEALAPMDKGHNKYLESMCIWLDITAPRYWWQEFDTYRVGVTKQSESTMHTLMKTPISQGMFEGGVCAAFILILEDMRQNGDFKRLKRHLPESFLQRRIVCTNYKAIRHCITQRWTHTLEEWKTFCNAVIQTAEHPEMLPRMNGE